MFAISLTDDAQLRPLEVWQAEEFLSNLDRCREHIRPWVGPSFVAENLAEAREVLGRYANGQAHDGKRIFGIWRDGTLVGGVMFVAFDVKSGVCEVGCWLEPSAEGHGLVTRSVRVLLDWAFGARGLSRAEWWTIADNAPSIAVAKRLGMSLDGTLRSSDPGRGGGRRDQQVWSVLAEEWNSAAA
jgi:RimJ/RimL family protein N-acetyltransferase